MVCWWAVSSVDTHRGHILRSIQISFCHVVSACWLNTIVLYARARHDCAAFSGFICIWVAHVFVTWLSINCWYFAIIFLDARRAIGIIPRICIENISALQFKCCVAVVLGLACIPCKSVTTDIIFTYRTCTICCECASCACESCLVFVPVCASEASYFIAICSCLTCCICQTMTLPKVLRVIICKFIITVLGSCAPNACSHILA